MNLLIYYNQNQKNFYLVYTNHIFSNYYVGYENGYGHMIVQILVVRNNKYINVNQFFSVCNIPYKEGLKSRLANKLIRWLNKYRE